MADSNTEGESCWVCLSGLEDAPDKALELACRCPRPVHRECLARWQLQQAGRREEHYCRFCEQAYPDWKDSLTPKELKPSTPIMAVSVRGRVHKLRVRPGPDGKEDFKRQVRALLGYDDSMEFDVIFECKTPHSGEKVQLHGFSAFDAATHCAAVSAAKRLKNKAHRTSSAAAAAAAGGSLTSFNCSGSIGPESISRSSSAPAGTTSSNSSSSSPPSSSSLASPIDGLASNSVVTNHLMAEYRSVAQPASTSTADMTGQQQQQQGLRAPFPPTTVPDHLQAQYRHFVQQRHQQHVAKQRALRARAAAAGQTGYSSEASAAAVAAAGLPSPAMLGAAEPAAAWSAAGVQQQPQQQGRPSSSGSAAADASALLTAGQMQTFAGAAATPAAELQLSCPLPNDPCASSSSSNAGAATAEEIWANCGSISDPLPALPVIYRSHSAPSGPPAAAGERGNALVRTTSSNVELAPSSVGCLGRWAVSPPGTPRLQQQPGRRKQPRKLAEVASGWLKQLAAKKAGKVRG